MTLVLAQRGPDQHPLPATSITVFAVLYTAGLPASLSRAAITEELREREGFDGLIVTDDLGMGAVAVHHEPPAAAVNAVSAGADLALMPTPQSVVVAQRAIADAIADGRLPVDQADRSVARVLRAKGITGECPG